MQGLGRLKKSPPTIPILGLALPISDSQPLCIPHHSIHPSEVWPSHSPSALRLVQGDLQMPLGFKKLRHYTILHLVGLTTAIAEIVCAQCQMCNVTGQKLDSGLDLPLPHTNQQWEDSLARVLYWGISSQCLEIVSP